MIPIPRQHPTLPWYRRNDMKKWLNDVFSFFTLKRDYRLDLREKFEAPAAVAPELKLYVLRTDAEFLYPKPGMNVRGCPTDRYAFLIAVLQAFTAHEAGHVKYTRFAVWPEKKRLASLVNSLEDERLERLMSVRYPATEAGFTLLGDLYSEHTRLGLPTSAGDKPHGGYTGAILEGCLFWRWEHDRPTPSWAPANAELWDQVRPLVEAAWVARNTDEVVDLAQQILALLPPPERRKPQNLPDLSMGGANADVRDGTKPPAPPQKPDASQQGASQPDASQPDEDEDEQDTPDGSGKGKSKPDSGKEDSGKEDSGKEDSGKDGSEPDPKAPEADKPDPDGKSDKDGGEPDPKAPEADKPDPDGKSGKGNGGPQDDPDKEWEDGDGQPGNAMPGDANAAGEDQQKSAREAGPAGNMPAPPNRPPPAQQPLLAEGVEGLARRIAPLLRPPETPAVPVPHRSRGRFQPQRYLQGAERVFRSFEGSGRPVPVDLRMLMDNSGSMDSQNRHVQAKKTALLLSRAASLASSHFELISFDTSPRRVGDHTTTFEAFVPLLQRHPRPGGGTQMLPALQMALQRPVTPDAKGVVVCVTDGALDQSDLTACHNLVVSRKDVLFIPVLIGEASTEADAYRRAMGSALVVKDVATLTVQLSSLLSRLRAGLSPRG